MRKADSRLVSNWVFYFQEQCKAYPATLAPVTSSDVFWGLCKGCHMPPMFEIARKLVKSQPCYKRGSQSVVHNLFSF